MLSYERVGSLVKARIDSTPGIMLTEASFGETIVNVVKAFLNKLYNIAKQTAEKCRARYRAVVNAVKNFFRETAYRNKTREASNRWNSSTIDDVRIKAREADFDKTFEMHRWDSRYINSLPERMQNFDEKKLAVNGQTMSITAQNLVLAMQDAIDKSQFDPELLHRYTDTIEHRAPSIFDVRGGKLTEEAILQRAGMTNRLRIPVTQQLVDEMIRDIETAPDALYNISLQYRDLAASYKEAENKMDSLILSNPTDSAEMRRFMNMVRSILQSKNIVFNTVQGAHVKIINTRCNEYMSVLLDFVGN